jgi:hypothetical protein
MADVSVESERHASALGAGDPRWDRGGEGDEVDLSRKSFCTQNDLDDVERALSSYSGSSRIAG